MPSYAKYWANPEAAKAAQKRYATKYPEKMRARRKLWEARHPELKRAVTRAYRQRVKVHETERVRLWRRDHPGQYKSQKSRRRARDAFGTHFTGPEWDALVEFWSGCCAYCGQSSQKLTADHRIPLSRGGTNAIDNVLPACRSCNSRKNTYTETEYRLLRLEAAA